MTAKYVENRKKLMEVERRWNFKLTVRLVGVFFSHIQIGANLACYNT